MTNSEPKVSVLIPGFCCRSFQCVYVVRRMGKLFTNEAGHETWTSRAQKSKLEIHVVQTFSLLRRVAEGELEVPRVIGRCLYPFRLEDVVHCLFDRFLVVKYYSLGSSSWSTDVHEGQLIVRTTNPVQPHPFKTENMPDLSIVGSIQAASRFRGGSHSAAARSLSFAAPSGLSTATVILPPT